MDRYLIDLMIEQVREGNKIGYTFNDEAWIHMAVSFVERFGLGYDQDLLKIHHKSLGKQYNDIRNLLGQRGFSWDETRQMVTAHIGVWDAYLEGNPGAKSFRSKQGPNYNDLCLIYGNSTSVGNYKQSCQDCSSPGHGAELNNGQCRRTDWRPAMDRYFIDLMLEQVRQGNMINQRFSKLAWSDIIVAFRAEFGPQHDEDALKKRFVDLRKQFNDMKNILGQSGFAWDEMQQMIIANHDDLWDAYVKECPDARLYCRRTLPNYNDLFLIYTNDTRQNSGTHSVETGDYALALKIYQEDGQSPYSSDTQELRWTKPMENYFIELMMEQVRRGNKIGHAFDERAWAWMTTSFNERFGLKCDKEVLEQRYFCLMREYDDAMDLHSQDGLARNNFQHAETDDDGDDNVEDAYHKKHPTEFRGGSFDKYKALCIIYGGKSCDVDNIAPQSRVDNTSQDLHTPAIEFGSSEWRNKKRKSGTSTSSSCSRKVKRLATEEIEDAVDEMPSFIKMQRGDKENKVYSSIESIVDALQTVPEIDDELFLEACELLEDERKAKMFIGMDANQRRKWLLKKLQQ